MIFIFHFGTVVEDLLLKSLQLPEKGLTSLVGSFSPWTQGISWDLANRAGPGPANGVGTHLSGEFLVSLAPGDSWDTANTSRSEGLFGERAYARKAIFGKRAYARKAIFGKRARARKVKERTQDNLILS